MRSTSCNRSLRGRGEQGQSLLETAIAMPLLLGIAFNFINVSYFWVVVLSLSSAPRMAVQYASQGGSASATVSAPGTTAVSNIAYDNVTNAIKGATSSNVSVRVCTIAKGLDTVTGLTLCDEFGPAYTFSALAADPEAPVFALDRVDVEYTVAPVIPGAAFSIVLPNLHFHRQVSMRSLF